MISALELRVREVVWVAPHVIPWTETMESHCALCVASRRIHFHLKGPSSKPVSRRLCHSPLDQEKRTHRTRGEFLSLRSTPVFTQWNHFSNQAHTQLARLLFCSQNWAVCSYLYQRFFQEQYDSFSLRLFLFCLLQKSVHVDFTSWIGPWKRMVAKPTVGVITKNTCHRVFEVSTSQGFPAWDFPGNETKQSLALGSIFPK